MNQLRDKSSVQTGKPVQTGKMVLKKAKITPPPSMHNPDQRCSAA